MPRQHGLRHVACDVGNLDDDRPTIGTQGQDGDGDSARSLGAPPRSSRPHPVRLAGPPAPLELARTHLRLANILAPNGNPAEAGLRAAEARRAVESLAALARGHKELQRARVWVHDTAWFIGRLCFDWALVAREQKAERWSDSAVARSPGWRRGTATTKAALSARAS